VERSAFLISEGPEDFSGPFFMINLREPVQEALSAKNRAISLRSMAINKKLMSAALSYRTIKKS